ncbi:hypothetical protein LSCM1_08085 [Leishmania martiniquensis]|uniref:TLDc domain-containing protein n=1 Tax=Leishmania martiniquensis TaxID=1580590 RepID=A0A836I0D4_9TRYP|nr:hypothetical protein LSCM1_08085 [Leishmania martiniquensis]
MKRPPADLACGGAAETEAVPPSATAGGSPPNRTATPTASPPPVAAPLTDTQLLQLSLRSAVAAAEAGKATVAANNYALVIKIIFRKCFLLEELVLLALAMGYELRKAAETAASAADGDDDRSRSGAAETGQQGWPHSADLHASEAEQQLMDPLASVGTLLPPGLDEDDYDEERAFLEEKRQHEEQHGHQHVSALPAARGGASTASPVLPASPPADDSTPGYDTATAWWIACLLAKVHPDALPIATLENICKLPLTSSLDAAGASPARRGAVTRGWPTSTILTTSNADPTSSSSGSFPCSTRGNGSPATSTVAAVSLLPHLKSSPASSPPTAVSPSFASGRRGAPRGSPNANGDATASAAAAAAPSSPSLSLLFATLIWDVACALWNEGYIEDAHHWLSVMDVRRLWALYKDLCSRGGAAGGDRHAPSSLFASGEPLEEDVSSNDRACALSWPAVLAESRAADEPPHSRLSSVPSAAREGQAEGTDKDIDSVGVQRVSAASKPAGPQSRSGILLSALAETSGPLPMAGLAACFGNPVRLEGGNGGSETKADDAVAATATQPRTGTSDDVGDGAAAAAAVDSTTRTAALAIFVRRLARRISALRDLCGLMIACETAEDVFYVIYALDSALATQQWKRSQQQAQQRCDEAATSGASATNGGLSELLILTNLLIEFFITKRAQQFLLEEGELDHLASAIHAATSPSAARGRDGDAGGGGNGAEDAHHHHQQQQHRLTDRAIRRACDEVVCAFTNGRCLTLYALEAYGIPPPYDSESSTADAQLLARELPFVLVSNALSSTLNYSALYRCSKVFRGVMGCHGCLAAPHHRAVGVSSASPVLRHPNHTRRSTEDEKARRRAWTTTPPPPAAPAAATSPHVHPSTSSRPATIADSALGVAGELFRFMKGTVVSWRNPGNAAQASAPPESRRSHDGSCTCSHHHQDVRPSFIVGDAPGADARLRQQGDGGYAERLSAARRQCQATVARSSHQAELAQGEMTPWSAREESSVMSKGSGGDTYLRRADGDPWRVAPSANPPPLAPQGRPGRRGPRCALMTRGASASELMLPSSSSSSPVAVPLLPEEHERNSPAGLVSEPAAMAAPETSDRVSSGHDASSAAPSGLRSDQQAASAAVLHTAAAQLQSCLPTEAVSLRLLALLYRYPQLHTLEPVPASHVDLVAKELNKALHILQTAMRGRFGDGWWLQWRSRREDETQRYYARALADAQRGGSHFSLPTTAVPSPSCSAAGAGGTATAPGETMPPRMIGMTAVQPDPSLLLIDARRRRTPATHERGDKSAVWEYVFGCDGAPPAPAPPPPLLPSWRADTVTSALWNAHALSIPTHKELRRPLHESGERLTTTTAAASPQAFAVTADAKMDRAPASAATMHGDADEDGMLLDVDWDVPPAYTPDVSLDFSAFTTTSVETQESTRQFVESLQQREQARSGEGGDKDDECNCDGAEGAPGVSVLSRACRRLLHNELPLLQQYCPWRVIYSTRMHGISLSTLFANCRREAERQGLSGCGATSALPAVSYSKPMLLVLELPSSTTLHFAEDDVGVQEAFADAGTPGSTSLPPSAAHQEALELTGTDGGRHHRQNKLFIGAFLSDLLRLDSRRCYGSQDCFVFQLLVPGTAEGAETASSAAHRGTGSPPLSGVTTALRGPQLRVHRASRCNSQFINCRTTSIVIGGGDSGSSIYLDDTLCHGATSACSTFSSPPLSTWVSAPCTAAEVGADGVGASCRRQRSLCVLNVEVIVMDV